MNRFYRNKNFSEQSLFLKNEKDEIIDSYPIHHIVWATESKYFDSLFIRWKNNEKELTYHVKNDEADAFDTIIKYFYSKTLEVSDIRMLYRTVLLADKLSCDLSKVAVKQLQTFNIEGVDVKSLSLFYDAPTGVIMNDEFMYIINSYLFNIVGDFNKIVCTPTLLQEFMNVSYDGMRYLLSRNDLITESEDIVLILVILWINTGAGSLISLESRRQIGNLIRLINISELLLTQIVPKTNWIDINADEMILLKQMKTYKRIKRSIVGDNFAFQEGETFKSNVSWFLSDRMFVTAFSKSCFLIDLDMPPFVRWCNGTKSTPYNYFFTHRQGCIIFKGLISISDTNFTLKIDTPVIYGLNTPVVYTYHGSLSLKMTRDNLMTISEKFYIIGMCNSSANYKPLRDIIPLNAITENDKLCFHLCII